MKELQFYRCVGCGSPVSDWDIKMKHGCPKCKNTKLKYAELTFKEKIQQIIKHPMIWRWGDEEYFK